MTKQETVTASVNNKVNQQFAVVALLAMGMCLLFAVSASADWTPPDVTGMSVVLCNAAFLVVFDVARGLASLAIIAIGVAAMLGKATWGQAMSLGVGIGVVFGALNLTTYLTSGIAAFLSLTLPDLPCMMGTR